MMINIGPAIRRVRIASSYSQDGLAYLVGCPRSYISKIENGHSVPKLEQICRIADALGVSVSVIIRDAECFVSAQIPKDACAPLYVGAL